MHPYGNTISSLAILELGDEFYDPVVAAEFPRLRTRFLNKSEALGLNLHPHLHFDLNSEADWQKYFARFEPLPHNLPTPLALRYHGHQFRHYNPELGDGRGFLFAQFQRQEPDGSLKLLDLGTKGSGQTPWSRGGDGRLTLKGAVREALATEMLEALGVNTSKTLCFFETGESLQRSDEPSPTRAAVLTRLSHGHIRFGTFQRLAYLGQTENIKHLMHYCLKYFYPLAEGAGYQSNDLSAEHLLTQVCIRSARLAAEWMIAGFVHGVLNTDNMNISGESFDYGPYRFLPSYDPTFTAAYFDQQGLYCFGRQPNAVFWNVQQLAVSLLKAYPNLNTANSFTAFEDTFSKSVESLFLKRLNLRYREPLAEDRSSLGENLLTCFYQSLEQSQIPLEQAFFDFWGGQELHRWSKSNLQHRYSQPEFQNFLQALGDFEIADRSKIQAPYWQRERPCTLLIDEIESIWSSIDLRDDWSLFESKIAEIRSMRGLHM